VSCFKYHPRRNPGVVSVDPPADAQTPAVTGLEPGESKLGSRGAEIVAFFFGELEERVRDYGTEQVNADIVRMGFAAAGPRVSGERI